LTLPKNKTTGEISEDWGLIWIYTKTIDINHDHILLAINTKDLSYEPTLKGID